LDNAVEYIAADKPTVAANVALKIWNATQRLDDQPGMGRPGRVSGTRELVVPGLPYILPYVEKEGAVFILRVMHASMKWPKKF
jgi:plasmid stabilization system protein ParE